MVVGYDLVEADYQGNLCPRNRADSARHSDVVGGLVGLYVCQSEAAGLLGLVGFLMSFSDNALIAGAVWVDTFIVPWLAWGLLSC